ncbi:MAG TPA: toll/interleukin-1 receptor domain-containing protein [Terracidiphilus sp.]|nr:toll/interleukin-1 receptor domain-containing protein [Terracidiphilus sp.]
MGRAIFISYRRDDTEGEAGRLFDDLVRTFGDQSVFMDVTDIKPGLDFRKVIDDNVADCGVLLAVIGPTWATITGGSGERRLDNPNDFVRLEIASALARDIAVIPVLVHDAKMPHPDLLPDNLKDLAYRNSVEITHARWNSDVQLLIKALGQYVSESNATSTDPVHATVAVQLPPANPPAHEPAPDRTSRTLLIVGIAVAAVLVIAAIAFFVFRGSTTTSPLAGTWTNPLPEAQNGLNKLEIAATGNQLSIHAWGACQPIDCDWGVQAASFDGQKATASWSFMKEAGHKESGRVATVTMIPDNGRLNVAIVNSFPNHPATQRQFEFERTQ